MRAIDISPSVIRDLSTLGPFFAIDTHPPSSPALAPWREMKELVSDPTVLRERVREVRVHLAAGTRQAIEMVPSRVAASVTQLGLTARVISPVLAITLATGQVPDIDLGYLRWQPILGGAFPLSIQTPLAIEQSPHEGADKDDECDAERRADMLATWILDGPVRDLVEATRPMSVSELTLWSNVASAVHGAASVIATARPSWARPASRIVSSLLDRPPLVGASTVTPDGRFRRRGCCLIYRAAPGGTGQVCGDCVLSGTTSGAATRVRSPRRS